MFASSLADSLQDIEWLALLLVSLYLFSTVNARSARQNPQLNIGTAERIKEYNYTLSNKGYDFCPTLILNSVAT